MPGLGNPNREQPGARTASDTVSSFFNQADLLGGHEGSVRHRQPSEHVDLRRRSARPGRVRVRHQRGRRPPDRCERAATRRIDTLQRARRQHRRPRDREPQRSGRRDEADHPRRERLLPARLQLDAGADRRQVPRDQGPREAAGRRGPRAQGLLGLHDRGRRARDGAAEAGRAVSGDGRAQRDCRAARAAVPRGSGSARRKGTNGSRGSRSRGSRCRSEDARRAEPRAARIGSCSRRLRPTAVRSSADVSPKKARRPRAIRARRCRLREGVPRARRWPPAQALRSTPLPGPLQLAHGRREQPRPGDGLRDPGTDRSGLHQGAGVAQHAAGLQRPDGPRTAGAQSECRRAVRSPIATFSRAERLLSGSRRTARDGAAPAVISAAPESRRDVDVGSPGADRHRRPGRVGTGALVAGSRRLRHRDQREDRVPAQRRSSSRSRSAARRLGSRPRHQGRDLRGGTDAPPRRIRRLTRTSRASSSPSRRG